METDFKAIRSEILKWLKNHLVDEAMQWIETTSDMLKKEPEDWQLYTSFSSVPRFTGKDEIPFSEEELMKADTLRKGWNPKNWRTDQLTRTYFILCFADQGEKEFLDKIEKIILTSDLGEAVALYQAIPVYPF